MLKKGLREIEFHKQNELTRADGMYTYYPRILSDFEAPKGQTELASC